MTTYNIKRMYFEDTVDNRVIAAGLTLEEAQQHCKDAETSSRTASESTLETELDLYGSDSWFDGYDEE